MKKAYFEPDFELVEFRFASLMSDDDDDDDSNMNHSVPEGGGQGLV